jgi:hypothetical protein
MAHRKFSLPALAGLLLATLALPAVAANIYKYLDENGGTVFNSYIPAEYVSKGYTILNSQGQVIQVVPRAATPEEIAAQAANKAAEEQALADRLVQQENDKLLTRLYRAPDEIERKRDYTLDQMKTQQDLARLGLTKASAEVARVQAIIDTAKKEGREPSADAVKKIEDGKTEESVLQAQINKMETDKAKVIADASRDIMRLREIMGLPPIPLEQTLPAPVSAAATDESASAEQTAAQ